MKSRAVILTGALLAAGLAGTAEAGKAKLPCNNMTDPTGDVVFTQESNASAYEDAALDLVSADLGANKKVVTAVIRVSKLAVPTTTAPGATYEMRISNPAGDEFTLWANLAASGNTFGVGTVDDAGGAGAVETSTSTGTATGVVDLAKSEIHVTAPYSAFSGFKPGMKVGIDDVIAKRGVPGQFYGRYADDGPGSKSLPLGTPTCVTPGK